MEVYLSDDYVTWLMQHVSPCPWNDCGRYLRLFRSLGERQFRSPIARDQSRVSDAARLRSKYWSETLETYTECGDSKQPVSWLEVLVAMSVRCEEDIMDRPGEESRVPLWFWSMLRTMGVDMMTNEMFDPLAFDMAVARLDNRSFRRNGEGGLFLCQRPVRDMRYEEYWAQMMWWLNEYSDEEEDADA